jgi:hypothetical protein
VSSLSWGCINISSTGRPHAFQLVDCLRDEGMGKRRLWGQSCVRFPFSTFLKDKLTDKFIIAYFYEVDKVGVIAT